MSSITLRTDRIDLDTSISNVIILRHKKRRLIEDTVIAGNYDIAETTQDIEYYIPSVYGKLRCHYDYSSGTLVIYYGESALITITGEINHTDDNTVITSEAYFRTVLRVYM